MFHSFSTRFSSVTQENVSVWVPGRASQKIPTLLEIMGYVLELKKENVFCQMTSTNF